MRPFFEWHKRYIKYWQDKFGLDSYTILWITFLKGFTLGAILFWFI